jgi:hypothetical protein
MWSEEQDELDRVLDRVLSEYSAEPRSGITERVLWRVRREGQATRRAGPAWALWGRARVASLLVSLLVAGMFLFRNGLREEPANAKQTAGGGQANSMKAAVVVEPAPAAGVIPRSQEVEGTIRASLRRSELPKLDVFPTPSPLTPAELALVKITEAVPSEAAARREGADTVQLESIRIPVLEIKPLPAEGDEHGGER